MIHLHDLVRGTVLSISNVIDELNKRIKVKNPPFIEFDVHVRMKETEPYQNIKFTLYLKEPQ